MEQEYVVPLAALDGTALERAGGKAANLGELIRAGLPVPDGFCVTTAGYALAAAAAQLQADVARVATGGEAREAQDRLLAAPVPAPVREAVAAAYRVLGPDVPVAVRSSATAEDLPTASFAGQQDTFLGVVGIEAVLDAVRRCWASLWNERAVSYRASVGVESGALRLAVVVQRMVAARAAGVLFTANPLTGRRLQAVVDVAPGLGEAVVSGAVNPDHYVVDPSSGEVLERRPVGPPTVTDDELRSLARLGARIEEHFGAPQDIEFAFEAGANGEARLWLLQARPITTLYPLSPTAPRDELRVYFSVNVQQGVLRPLTPMGLQALRLFAGSMASAAGHPPRDPFAGPSFLTEAGHRLFLDLTSLLRNRLGRRAVLAAGPHAEARAGEILADLVACDPRLALTGASQRRTALAVARALLRTRIPQRALAALARPPAGRTRAAVRAAAALSLAEVPASADSTERLDALERLLRDGVRELWTNAVPVLLAGVVTNIALARLLRGIATDTERRVLARGLPHNPTTEMDLELWELAERTVPDAAAASVLAHEPPEELARRYREGSLPPVLQRRLAEFLGRYGHRAVAEIDLGVPRWSDDPTHLLAVLANYRRHSDPDFAPDVQFARAQREAEAMVRELRERAVASGRARGAAVGFFLGRLRELLGQREAPKSYLVRLFATGRALLGPVGEQLARADRLDAPDDVFFLTLPEVRAGLIGADLRPLVRRRRASYDRELRRRHVPRVLLSDGTEPVAAPRSEGEGVALRGTAASPGSVTAPARVLRDPAAAPLRQGEVLVAPSTDPGWTPLFLTAGGLVMEMGGAMSHGAVVAREYGIPAVVAVAGATERIADGQVVTVDGSRGVVHLTG